MRAYKTVIVLSNRSQRFYTFYFISNCWKLWWPSDESKEKYGSFIIWLILIFVIIKLSNRITPSKRYYNLQIFNWKYENKLKEAHRGSVCTRCILFIMLQIRGTICVLGHNPETEKCDIPTPCAHVWNAGILEVWLRRLPHSRVLRCGVSMWRPPYKR